VTDRGQVKTAFTQKNSHGMHKYGRRDVDVMGVITKTIFNDDCFAKA